MHAELIHVGTELLLGGILNTNAQYLSLRLAELGIDLYFQTVVGDNQSRIIEALKIAGKRADIVILTGGLGPTSDDLTKESLCSFLNVPLFLREDILASIEEIFQKRGTKMPRNNVKQAMFPKEGIILENDMGTAPGLFISQKETSFYLLPGPPSEMKNMFEKEVFPILSSQIGQTLHSIPKFPA